MSYEGILFLYAKRHGLYKFPPNKGDILLSSNADKTYGVFTGINSEELKSGTSSKDIKFGTTFAGAWFSTHYEKWLAIHPETYKKLLIQESEPEYDPPKLPPVPTDCEIGFYNIYRVYSRHDKCREGSMPKLPSKYDHIMGYEHNDEFCIIALNETSARQLCNTRIESEYKYSEEFWLDPKWSACELLGKASVDNSKPRILTVSNTGS